MWAGGRLGAPLLPSAASSPPPTGHEQLQRPPLASPHGTGSPISLPSRDLLPPGRQPQGFSSLHPH